MLLLVVVLVLFKLKILGEEFDVIVTSNLFGDILSDESAGLVGGLGLAPSGNIGDENALFEPVHGSAPDIAGQDKANPTALLLCALEMLNYIGENTASEKIKSALFKTFEQKIFTADLGGNASCSEFTKAIIKNLK